MIINARLNRKDARTDTQSCVIEKVIELDYDGFELFKNNLLQDYPFIESHKHLMGFDDNGKAHCILVIGEDTDDGILIESEGSNYARYSSFIPNARQILLQEQMSPTLKDFVETLQERMNQFVKDILFKCEYDHYTINFDEIQSQLGEYSIDKQLFIDLLCERDEIGHTETSEDEIVIYPKDEYLEEPIDNDLSEVYLDESCNEDIELICAKHILWLYDTDNGERANFTNHRIDNNDFIGKNLCSANLANGVFNNCSFKDASLCFITAENAVFNNCDFTHATAEESEFVNCKFVNCKMNNSMFTHSALPNCTFKGCEFFRASFRNTMLKDTQILTSDGSTQTFNLPDTEGASYDSDEWYSENEGVIQE